MGDVIVTQAAKFMRHNPLCGTVGGYDRCTCGMEEAKDALLAATPVQNRGEVVSAFIEAHTLAMPDGDIVGCSSPTLDDWREFATAIRNMEARNG